MASPAERKRARRRFRPFRLTLLLILLAAGSLFEPNCFRFAVRYGILFEAWRNGVSAQISGIEGSLYEPLQLRNSVWIYESAGGPITRVEIQNATAEFFFSWRNLFSRSSVKWFQRLSLEGVSGKILLPLDSRAPAAEGFKFHLPRLTGRTISAPERIEARNVDFVFQSADDFVRLAQTEFTLSNVEPGTIRAGQILIHQPWLTRTFREVRGTTKMEGATIDIANLTLEQGVQVRDISVDLGNLARGFLNLEMEVAAFGGTIRIEAQTLSDAHMFGLDATGTFSQISVAKLATFLSISDAAGGTIKDGKFTFRGPPQRIAEATASLHFEAVNFQWDSRQWDSLVAGASLMDGWVQVPGVALTQGHNQLNLNGEMALPAAGLPWWQSEFNVNIAAKIDNLTELSALLLPEFKFAAGKANIDGSIRGKNQQFNGQIIVSGSELQWRNAPIDELHASVKLKGNEFQITNLSIFNDGDFVRGRGVVNILGDKQYWGELHSSILDLSKYSSIIQKPLVPEPLAGGAKLEWSGEGSAKGHSGKFLARLQKLRSLGATAALLHPINAELEGTYAAGGMTFSQFSLSDDESSFTANVAIGSKILSLQGIRLMNKQTVWLEGDALLPFDVWNAWPNTSFATLLDDHTGCRLNLTAHELQLRETSYLTGWKFPIEGIVNGNLSGEGDIGALKTSGKVSLRKGRIPLGGGESLNDTELDAAFEGHTMQVARFAGRNSSGDFTAAGQIDFSSLRDPNLQLDMTSKASAVRLFANPPPSLSAFLPAAVTTALNLKITGPLSAGKVEGDAQIASLNLGGSMDVASVLTESSAEIASGEKADWPRPLAFASSPWTAWIYDVHCQAASNAQVAINWRLENSLWKETTGATPVPQAGLEMDLHFRGVASDPALVGTVHIQHLPARSGAESIVIEDGSWEFRPAAPRNPSVTLQLAGTAFGEAYTVDLALVGRQRWRFFHAGMNLNEKLIQSALNGEYHHAVFGDEDVLHLEVPRLLSDAINTYAWPAIGETQPAPAPPSIPAPSATPGPPPASPPPPPTKAPNSPSPTTPAPAPAPAAPPSAAPASSPVPAASPAPVPAAPGATATSSAPVASPSPALPTPERPK